MGSTLEKATRLAGAGEAYSLDGTTQLLSSSCLGARKFHIYPAVSPLIHVGLDEKMDIPTDGHADRRALKLWDHFGQETIAQAHRKRYEITMRSISPTGLISVMTLGDYNSNQTELPVWEPMHDATKAALQQLRAINYDEIRSLHVYSLH